MKKTLIATVLTVGMITSISFATQPPIQDQKGIINGIINVVEEVKKGNEIEAAKAGIKGADELADNVIDQINMTDDQKQKIKKQVDEVADVGKNAIELAEAFEKKDNAAIVKESVETVFAFGKLVADCIENCKKSKVKSEPEFEVPNNPTDIATKVKSRQVVM